MAGRSGGPRRDRGTVPRAGQATTAGWPRTVGLSARSPGRREQQQLGLVEVGRRCGRSRPASPTTGRRGRAPARRARSRSSLGVKHDVHSSAGRVPGRLVADLGALVVDATVSVEVVAVLEVADLEVGGEGRQRQAAARAQALGHPLRSRRRRRRVALPGPPSSPKPPWQSEMAASKRPGAQRQLAGVGLDEGGRRAGAPAAARAMKRAAMSKPTTPDAPPGEGVGVATGTATDVRPRSSPAPGRAPRRGTRPPARCPW